MTAPRTARRALAALAALLSLSGARPLAAQAERHELGRRLRAYEAAWETAARDARVKSYAGLPKVTGQFFGFQFGEAGRTLDDARRTLTGTDVTPPIAWAEALFVAPESRLIDAAKSGLEVVVKPFYTISKVFPANA